MYNDLYNEMIVVLTLLLLIYALTIPLILNTDDKIKHVKINKRVTLNYRRDYVLSTY